MFKSLVKLFAKVVNNFLPIRVFITFFGTGYLPAWQSYWASLLSLMIVQALFYMVYGLAYLEYDVLQVSIIKAIFFLRVFVVLLILGIISLFIFQQNNSTATSNDIIVLHFALGQILLASLTTPASLAIYYAFASTYDGVCKDIFTCPVWLNSTMYFFLLSMVPYFFFTVFSAIKPWPISQLQLTFNNTLSIMAEGLTYVIYSVVTSYLVAFVFFGLTLLNAINFLHYLISSFWGYF